ncbi:MAG: hypothetical protein WCG78_05730 [Candidatus Omnitrophota bacterium]
MKEFKRVPRDINIFLFVSLLGVVALIGIWYRADQLQRKIFNEKISSGAQEMVSGHPGRSGAWLRAMAFAQREDQDKPVRVVFNRHGSPDQDTLQKKEMIREYVKAFSEEVSHIAADRPVIVWMELGGFFELHPTVEMVSRKMPTRPRAGGGIPINWREELGKDTLDAELQELLREYYTTTYLRIRRDSALDTDPERILIRNEEWKQLVEWVRQERARRPVEIRFEDPPFESWLALLQDSARQSLALAAASEGNLGEAVRMLRMKAISLLEGMEPRDKALAEKINAVHQISPDTLQLVVRGALHVLKLPGYLDDLGLPHKVIFDQDFLMTQDPLVRYVYGKYTGSLNDPREEGTLLVKDLMLIDIAAYFSHVYNLNPDDRVIQKILKVLYVAPADAVTQWCVSIGNSPAGEGADRLIKTWKWLQTQDPVLLDEDLLVDLHWRAKRERKRAEQV